jgi:hypothetical protein
MESAGSYIAPYKRKVLAENKDAQLCRCGFILPLIVEGEMKRS